MNFYEKIQQIEKVLPSKGIRDSLILSCAIYYKMRLKVSLRKLPLADTGYTWFNLRYWLQKLQKTGQLQQIERIIGGAVK